MAAKAAAQGVGELASTGGQAGALLGPDDCVGGVGDGADGSVGFGVDAQPRDKIGLHLDEAHFLGLADDAFDSDEAVLQIDVAPVHFLNFFVAHAAKGLKDYQGDEVRPGGVEELAELLGCVAFDFDGGEFDLVEEGEFVPGVGELAFRLGEADEFAEGGQAVLSSAKAHPGFIEARFDFVGANGVDGALKVIGPKF